MAYSQNDLAWRDYNLGFGPGTIGNYGCFLTAFANVCKWADRDINPAQLNEMMKQRGWFSQDLVTNHQVPSELYPDVLDWAGETHWVGTTDMNFFNDASDPDVAYIVYIDASPAPGIQSHFTMVWAKSGDDLIIDDSWDGVRKNLSRYGNPPTIIQAAYKFKKNVKPSVSEPVVGDPDMARPTPEEIIQAYTNIAGRAPTQNDIDFHAANSTYKSMVKGFFDNNDTVVSEVTTLQQQLAADGQQISDLSGKLTDSNAAYKTAEADLTTVKQSLENVTKPLIDKTTPKGKSIRTFLQSMAALYALVTPLFTLPDVQALLSVQPGWAMLPAIGSAMTAIVTYIHNTLEKS